MCTFVVKIVVGNKTLIKVNELTFYGKQKDQEEEEWDWFNVKHRTMFP